MSIEFHCEHCNKLVKAPDEVGGRPGKCPHCKGMNYIPLPESETGEIPLEPVDPDFERHRRESAAEDFAYQRKIMSDRSTPGEPGRGRPRTGMTSSASSSSSASPAPSTSMTDKQASSLIVSFITAMANGSLPKAEEIAAKLRPHKAMVGNVLDDMLNSSNMSAYGLPTLPKPVLNGFVKQLRAKIS